MKLLIVSDRSAETSKTDFLVNELSSICDSKIIYNKLNGREFSLIDKLLYRLMVRLDRTDINKRIISEVTLDKYSHVLIVNGMNIGVKTLLRIKSKGIKLWHYSGDNPTKWYNVSWSFLLGLNIYDGIFCVNIPSYKNIEYIYKGLVIYFNKCVSKSLYFDDYKPNVSSEKIYDVIFIGSYENERAQLMEKLASDGISITIFGNGWNKYKNQKSRLNIKYDELIGKDYVDALRSAKVALGFLRERNQDTQTSRSFELPASGTATVLQASSTHSELFVDRHDLILFDTYESLKQSIIQLLNNEDMRNTLGVNGRQKILECEYFFDALANRFCVNMGLSSDVS